jgi:hypothetical protein
VGTTCLARAGLTSLRDERSARQREQRDSQSLTFAATLNSVGRRPDLGSTNFLNAALSTSGGIPDPGAQMGAHIQSLSRLEGCSTSRVGRLSAPPTSSVPEPTTLP